MDRETLISLEPLELLKLLRKQVDGAISMIEGNGLENRDPWRGIRGIDYPLCSLGDFDIWMREDW